MAVISVRPERRHGGRSCEDPTTRLIYHTYRQAPTVSVGGKEDDQVKLSILLACSCTAMLAGPREDVDRLKAAARVFQEVMQTPDQAIPQELLPI